MKTAVSIPDELFRRADDLAQRRKMARSALYAEALQEYLERHRGTGVTEQLDQVYSDQSSALDPGLAALQRKSVLESGSDW